MDIFYTFFTLASIPLLFIFTTFLYLMLKLYIGNYIKDPNDALIYGTVFQLFFHYNNLYDHQATVARKLKTFRLVGLTNSDLYTTDIRNIEHVLKNNFHKYTKGKFNHEALADLFGDGIFNVDGNKWKQQRKLASFEFSNRVLRDFSSSVFRKKAAILVKFISNLAVANQAFDMQDILMRYTLDSICKVGFGVELNCLEGSSKEGITFMKAFDDSCALIPFRYIDPFWKLKRYFNLGREALLKNNIKIIDDFVVHLMKIRRQAFAQQQQYQNVKEDILSRFIVESEKNPDEMNDKYLRDIILNFMIAGKDTTANTLSWFFYMLCKNPLIQGKIFQEIIEVMGSDDNDDNALEVEDFAAKISDKKLEQMHYLHATLSETLRLYPVVPLDGRCSEIDDVLPDGSILKKGDGLQYMAYAMGRMPYIWGEDAEEFRPERWLQNGIFQPQSPFKFVAFHAGPRTCLGKDFAYRQMKIISMALLRFFRFELADKIRKVNYRITFTLHIHEGLHLRAISRIN